MKYRKLKTNNINSGDGGKCNKQLKKLWKHFWNILLGSTIFLAPLVIFWGILLLSLSLNHSTGFDHYEFALDVTKWLFELLLVVFVVKK